MHKISNRIILFIRRGYLIVFYIYFEFNILLYYTTCDFYRLKVLEAGFDPLTKRIPASKYEMFVKQQFMMNAAIINGFYVKIDNLTIERKLLEKQLYQVAKQANGLCEVDHKQLELRHYKIYLEVKEKYEIEKKMKARRSKYTSSHIIRFIQYAAS